MQLEKILDRLGSIEKNSFIKIIDSIISEAPKNGKKIEKILSNTDKGLKSVDNQNIVEIFKLVRNEFFSYLKQEFQDVSSQLDILIDIIIRDGNCIMKQDWLSRLYDAEIKQLKKRIKQVRSDFDNEKADLSTERKRDYRIYKSCLNTAYKNDLSNNREAKITTDESSIILTLSKELGLSQEEVKLINYSILPIKKMDVQDVINSLKNMGAVFFSKKENTIYVADEMVRLLRKLREKEVADKFLRRTLKILPASAINRAARIHNLDRILSRNEKIEGLIKEGISFHDLLNNDIYKENTTLTEKKKLLNDLCEKGLGIKNLRGSTLHEKIGNLITHFDDIEKDEKVGISLDGFDKLLVELNQSIPKLNKQLKGYFELQEEFILNATFLLDYNLKPRDIIDLIEAEDLIKFISENGIKQRGDNVLNILEHYKDAENLYLENYENVAYRNLSQLKDNGILIKESELGLKFEEMTKVIFSKLGFNVNEKLRKSLSTKKDQIDILLSLDNGDVIIVECKTSKERGYNKFSSVSRQLRSYQDLALSNDFRIAKMLLIAPEFSDDFITDCEMDTAMNLSLITAASLTKVFEEFKVSKYEVFPYVLFRDIVINEKRIIKALQKK